MVAVLRRRVGRHWWGLVFVAPVVAFFAVFNLFPVVFGFAISLTDYDLLDPPNFVGLDNFRNLLDDTRVERVERIELSWPAWKAGTQPISHTRA